MKPLAAIQRVLLLFSVYPVDEKLSKSEHILTIISTWLIWFGDLCTLISSALFFLKYISTDLKLAIFVLCQFTACISTTNALIVLFIQRRRLADSFNRLAKIYRESKFSLTFR